MNVPPLPIEDPHPQQVVENRIVEGVLPFDLELFGHSTHVRPEVIIPVKLREMVELPMLNMLKRIVALFSWKNGTMPALLGDLKI